MNTEECWDAVHEWLDVGGKCDKLKASPSIRYQCIKCARAFQVTCVDLNPEDCKKSTKKEEDCDKKENTSLLDELSPEERAAYEEWDKAGSKKEPF
ncbi:hypothetical protein [Zooshikella harenae]|uniref:Uncharacterized protein n=1 Tax=Zooshikella harenae TaxID=2827238 RepID=A0ABS5ZIY8_9GAMM|nr:hypothetical protein [Zooshikella harenae]MBU2714038.1 hypothetical protein [Zooshikella harenae]